MNATLTYEPFKLPAGILALAVHLIFFALLYFGFSWQNTPPESISVDLWQSLPEPVVTLPAPIKPIEIVEAVKPTQPEQVIKADIAIPHNSLQPHRSAIFPLHQPSEIIPCGLSRQPPLH